MLFLNKDDVANLVTMEETIGVVEKAFLKHAEGKTVYPPKDQFMLPTDEWKWWGFMPIYVEDMGVACKIVCDYPENKNRGLPTIIATIVLNDVKTGELLAVMDGTFLTAVRTGALGGIAAKYMARKDSKTVGIIGCGIQARTQLEALTKVVDLEKAKIYDLNESSMDAFIIDMTKLGVLIEKSTPDEVVDSDILVAATVSQTPVILGEKIKPGTHVTSIGAHTPDARELDDILVNKSKIVIDSPDALKSGDLTDYKGELTELKDVLAGKKIRESNDDITLFKSVGTALQDVAAASIVYKKALKEGIGQDMRV